MPDRLGKRLTRTLQTCRLRRKKCDETRPLCEACATLEIECIYSDEKPEWMETVDTQKDRAEWLKLEVKRKAAERRERRYLQAVERGIESLEFSHQADGDGSDRGRKDTPGASTTSSVPSSARRPDPMSETSRQADSSMASFFASLTPASSADSDTALRLGMDDRELNLVAMYLDYVFPFLFPFYRPRLMDAGRGWLLVLFTRNKALLHTALSLASLFFSIVLNHGSEDPVEPCKLHNVRVICAGGLLGRAWCRPHPVGLGEELTVRAVGRASETARAGSQGTPDRDASHHDPGSPRVSSRDESGYGQHHPAADL